MKKLKFFFLFICLSLSNTFSASAQYNVNWGPIYEKEGGMFSSFYLAGGDTNNYYVVMRPKKENNLLKFDFNHKLKSTTPISFEFNGEDLLLREFITTKSKTFGIFSNYDKKENIFSIQAAQLEGGNFKPIKEVALQPYKIKYKYIGGYESEFSGYTDEDATGSFAISADKNYVATIRTLSSKESGQADVISVIVFDENMNVKWQKIQDFPYKDKKLDIQDFIISNNGDVFLAVTLDLPKKEKEKGIPYYNYQVVKITENDYKEYKLNLTGNNVISSAGLFISPKENEIFIGGLCKDKDRETDGDNGLFYSKLDISTGNLNTKVHQFSKELLDGLVKNKKIEGGDGLVSFRIKDFITFSDNSFSFIAEKTYRVIYVTYQNGRKYTSIHYHTNEIIIPRFDQNGELQNLVKLDKDYSGFSPMIVSYSLGIKDNRLYLLYNDTKSRTEGVVEEKLKINLFRPYKGIEPRSYTTLSVIDNNGKLESEETLFTGSETDGFFFPWNSEQFGDKLLINIYSGKNYHFGTLKLE
jgi:hypothetical protein